FYSKRRLDGLQDLECLPCGSAHIRHTQCGCLSPRSHRDIAAASVSIATEYSMTQEAEYGCLDVSASSLPVEHSTLFSDITSCRVITQATESHHRGSVWAGHGPVECTEREILHGEKRTP
ncbi:hypothetical protein QTP86_031356, partial [Hemibagrus guttatus]